jgi:hypothetical protein
MDYARGEGSQGCQVSEALRVLIFATHWPTCLARAHLISETFRQLSLT